MNLKELIDSFNFVSRKFSEADDLESWAYSQSVMNGLTAGLAAFNGIAFTVSASKDNPEIAGDEERKKIFKGACATLAGELIRTSTYFTELTRQAALKDKQQRLCFLDVQVRKELGDTAFQGVLKSLAVMSTLKRLHNAGPDSIPGLREYHQIYKDNA